MIPTCWQKSVSLTVLLHWSLGKVIHNPRQWGIQKAVNTKFVDSFGALTLSGQLSCTHPLPSKHCCSHNTGKLSEEMPRFMSAPDRWTLCFHTTSWFRHHSGPIMQMHSSLYRFFLYVKAIQAGLHDWFLDNFSGYPLSLLPLTLHNLPFFVLPPLLFQFEGSIDQQRAKRWAGCNVVRRCPWGKGGKIREWSCPYM